MGIGSVVAFFEQKKILCAVCLEAKENKYHFLTEENREISLGPNRIVHISNQSLNPQLPREALVEELKRFAARQKKLMASISIQELWEVVCGEEGGVSLRDLTELIFDSRASSDHEMALFRALSEDRIYFKQKGELYEARDPEKVEQIIQQLAREAQQEQELAEAGAWLAGVWAGKTVSSPEKKAEIITWLKDMAVFGPQSLHYAQGKAVLERAKISSTQAPFELLVRLGEWGEDENLFLLQHEIPQTFSGKVIGEVEQILSQSQKGNSFSTQDEDLTFLHPLTIDNEFTRDIDDALSLERLGGEYRLGIHITNVATYLDGHGEIFQEAMARGTSIYLPDQRIPMLPPGLSEGACSLVAGEKRRALSFLVHVDGEGKILEYQIVPSVIQVERRLSYDFVDQLLEEGEEDLTCLQRLAEKFFRRRMGWGAFFIPRPERIVRVNRDKEITIFKRDRESPSQKMVSEFMILANCLAAQFLKEKGIPAIYRSQMEPREKVPTMEKFDPLQAYRLRRIMNRVEVSTKPMKHSGLGVEAYLTLTSPIRRFYDLLIERQILGALRGNQVFEATQLEKIITQVGPTISKVALVEELTERYWILRFLEKKVGWTTPAVILDRFPNKYLVHLNEYLLELEMAGNYGRDFIPGDQVLMRIEKAHARFGILKVSPV